MLLMCSKVNHTRGDQYQQLTALYHHS